jgi:type IV secretory pathway VirD2 relaxase
MPRIIGIHEKQEENDDLRISIGRSKKHVRSGAGTHYKSPASSLFLWEIVRSINRTPRHHSGRHLFTRNPSTASQRVVVKSRVVRHLSVKNGLKSLQDHCGYCTRKGVEEPDRKALEIYNGSGTPGARSLDEWMRNAAEDRHHFRFIVSPENSRNLDLTAFTRELVRQMESDLGTRLDYIAVNHFNTDTPHSHIIMRGVTDQGNDLVISRDYISNGVRNRAREIANEHLGLRTELEIRNGITTEIKREAFTSIDCELKRIASKSQGNVIDVRVSSGPERNCEEFRRVVRTQRLKFLEYMQLAREVKPGIWKLRDDFEETLSDLGIRNDIIKTMHMSLSAGNNQEKHIIDPRSPERKNVTGIVLEKGVSDELNDRKYMVISATDNRIYYVPLSKNSEAPGMEARVGAIVTVTVKGHEKDMLASDRKIMEIAADNDGIYSIEMHRGQVNRYRLPEGVTVEKYLENYIKRLKALERRGIIRRAGEGAWTIPPDLENRLKERGNSVKVALESADRLDKQVRSNFPTWIDRELATGRLPAVEISGSSFNRELNQAKAERIEKLRQMGIVTRTDKGITMREDYLEDVKKSGPRKEARTGRKYRDIER